MEFEIVTTCEPCNGTGTVENFRNQDVTCIECEGKKFNVYNDNLYDNILQCAEDYPEAICIRRMYIS